MKIANRRNKSLFWYGFFGKLKQVLGVYVISASLVLSIALSVYKGILFNVFWIGLILGLILIFKGKAQNFDYQKQSGNIIHKGDW